MDQSKLEHLSINCRPITFMIITIIPDLIQQQQQQHLGDLQDRG